MAKRKASNTDSGAKRQRSSSHRAGFDPSWSSAYPWLVPLEQDSTVIGLRCWWCTQHSVERQRNRSGVWTELPCTSLRKDCIERHARSETHIRCAESELMREQALRDGGLQMAFQQQVIAQRKAVIGALKVVYWLAKEEIAYTTKYESLLSLAQSLGCTYLSDLHCGRNASYTSRQVIGEFLQCLGKVIEKDNIGMLRASPYFSLMIDESTDVAVLKQLVVVARCTLPSGDVKTMFLDISDVPDGRAATIESALLLCMEKYGLDMAKMRGFGSDGAPVMVGRRSGVASRLKGRQPRLITIHCINHRLALAAGHAANHVQYLQKFKATVQTLFLFYHNSPVRMAGLHAIQAILDSPTVKLKQAKDVRWLSYDAAIKAIISTLPALIASLEREATERSEPAAVGLVKFVKTHYFVGCCYLLNKVLPHISRLSLIFQQEDIDLSLIKPALESTLASIEEVRTFQFEEMYSTVENVLQISVSESEKQHFRERVQYKFIDAVIDQINDRLPDCDELSAFSLLDPQKLPPCSGSEEINEAFQQWGNNHLVILEGMYGVGDNPDISKEVLRSEWVSLKHMISSTYRNTTMRSMLKLLVSNSTLQTMYPQFTKLACIALVIPVSTAECERSFSAMKRIKTDSRNRLLTENLNHLMRISIEGPLIDQFDFEQALELWRAMRQRRISI